MIIRGGENIYPREIEEYVLLHDSVEDVHVSDSNKFLDSLVISLVFRLLECVMRGSEKSWLHM